MPRLSAKSRLSIVFSRARPGAPRWPTIHVPCGVFQSLKNVPRPRILFLAGPPSSAASGSAASVTGRPRTRMSAPDTIADVGDAILRWSPAALPAGRMPGTTVRNPGPHAARTPATSSAEQTTPSRPQSRARSARRRAMPSGCPATGRSARARASIDVRRVTATTRGRGSSSFHRLAGGGEHRPAPERVNVDQRGAGARRGRDGASDRVGDVVELQVEEDSRAGRHDFANEGRASGDERLEADLQPADPRREPDRGLRHLRWGSEIERDADPLGAGSEFPRPHPSAPISSRSGAWPCARPTRSVTETRRAAQ